jgi:hypothetical protein
MAELEQLLPAPLKDAEYKLLCQAVSEANRWIGDGRFSAGYQCLLVGLERAKELAEGGLPWAEDLAASYREALFQIAYLYPRSQRTEMPRRHH